MRWFRAASAISARTCAGSSANAHCSYKDLSASLLPILKSSAIYILPFPATGGLVFLTVTSVPAGEGAYTKEKTMNNQIQPFEFEGNKVRALADGDEVMFVASDIAKILGYRDAANLTRNLDGDERDTHEVSTPSGTQNMTVLTESGLYRAILNRETAYVKNEEAQAFVKRFQRWVTHEVLPSIRKTGGYIPTSESDSDEDIMARAVLVAQKTIKQKNQQIASQQSRIVELEPKARFADAVAASDGTCLVGELAKMLRQNGMDIGQNRLFRLLQADGYLGKSGSNRNVPTQRAMDLGLFRIKETTVTHADGHTTVSRTPKVTGKGQRYFIDRYWGRTQPSLEAGA